MIKLEKESCTETCRKKYRQISRSTRHHPATLVLRRWNTDIESKFYWLKRLALHGKHVQMFIELEWTIIILQTTPDNQCHAWVRRGIIHNILQSDNATWSQMKFTWRHPNMNLTWLCSGLSNCRKKLKTRTRLLVVCLHSARDDGANCTTDMTMSLWKVDGCQYHIPQYTRADALGLYNEVPSYRPTATTCCHSKENSGRERIY